MSDCIYLQADAPTLTAGKPSRLRIVAYRGGRMIVAGFGEVVIDLAGLELPDSIPVLGDHDNRLDAVIASGVPEVKNGELHIVANLATGEASDQVVGLLTAKVPLKASVGVRVIKQTTLRSGETKIVNGKTVTAPAGGLRLITAGRLEEVSILPIGADVDTSVSLAARAAKGKTMTTDTNDTTTTTPSDEDILTAERQRTADIIKIATKFPDIQAKAVADGWDTKKTQLEVLRAGRPTVDARHQAGGGGYASIESIVGAVVMLRAGDRSGAEKHFGPVAAEYAERLRCRTMLDVCENVLRLEGRDIPSGTNKLIAAAFSTLSMPVALGDAASKVALDAYRATPQTWRSFAKVVSVRDFKDCHLIRYNLGREFDQVPPGGALHHATAGEDAYTVQADTFGMMISIDRRQLINDDLSLFSSTAASLGKAGARCVNDLIYKTLLLNLDPDGNDFFSVGNANYLDGAETALGMTSLQTAVANMLARVDNEGRVCDLAARVLLVPATLDVAAKECLQSQSIARYVTSGADRLPEGNALYRSLELAVEPRLGNVIFSGASSTGWYLFAAPSDGAVVAAFLNGVDSPTVEQVDPGPSVLGLAWRGYVDVGCALADPRAALKMAGA